MSSPWSRNLHARAPLLVLALLLAPFAAHAAELRSPWDGQTIAITGAPYNCPAPPPFAKTLEAEGYYTDSHYSIIDPGKRAAFDQATEAPTHLGQWIGLAADAYLTKGSRAAALCALSLLDSAARAHAWSGQMPTNNGSYEQKWLLGSVSVSWLKLRNSGLATPEQQKEILRWLGSIADRVTDYIDSHKANPASDAWNNHRYWAGFAVAAAGVAINNKGDFRWGIDSYKAGVDQIRPDGALPRELARAGMALHYHLYALAPLVMIAELAAANGIDLYAYDNGAIHRLERVCEAGLLNPGIFAKATGVPQTMPGTISGSDIGWAVPWVRRFPDAQLSAWIAHAATTRSWQWGGLPPGSSL